jgi:hypothetical protein
MIARALSLALAFCLPLAARGLEPEKPNPMRYVVAYSAADGVEIVESSPEGPFHLRVVGGDPRRLSTEQGQLWVPVGEHMYQLVITTRDEVMPGVKKQPDDRTLLAAHAAWECKDHNEILHLTQTAQPEFQDIAGRTWCHWTYDLLSLAKDRPKEAGDGPGPQTQHLLTTVLGRKIVVLIGTTLVGQKEDDTHAGLVAAARTFVVLPKPLTQPQIKELCSQKQP